MTLHDLWRDWVEPLGWGPGCVDRPCSPPEHWYGHQDNQRNKDKTALTDVLKEKICVSWKAI